MSALMNPNQTTDRRPRLTVIDLCSVLFMGYMLSGNTASYHLYLGIALFILWLVIAALSNLPDFQATFSGSLFYCVMIYLIYTFIMGLFVSDISFLLKQFGSGLLLYSPIFVYQYYSGEHKRYNRNVLCVLLLIVWIYFAAKSCVFLSQNEGAARELASYKTSFGDITIGGGYSLAFGSALLGCVGITLLVERRLGNKYLSVLVILFVALLTVLILRVQSTITIVCFIVGAFSCVVLRETYGSSTRRQLGTRLLGKLLLIALFGVLVSICMRYVGDWLITYSYQVQGSFGNRLFSLGAMLLRDVDEGQYGVSRMSIPLKTLKTFLSNPIFGVCYKHGNGYLPTAGFGLGNHCEWADALANLGLVGGIPFLLIYLLQARKIRLANAFGSAGWAICLLLLGSFNPLRAYQPHLVLFFLLPTIAQYYRHDTEPDSATKTSTQWRVFRQRPWR